ncbi:unnamed protein product, partial [marine sediment metagenome]
QAAHSTIACSGSVSLELLYFTRPTVIYYKLSRVFEWLFRRVFSRVAKIRYVTLVNLLVCDEPFCQRAEPWDPHGPRADEPIFPEYPTSRDKSADVAEHVIEWLRQPAKHERCRQRLEELKARVAHGGASRAAATAILARLAKGATSPQKHAVGEQPAADHRSAA